MEKDKKIPEIIEESGQVVMPLMQATVQKEDPEGVEMGVLENGMPYLSQRGVVKMVGIPRTTFQDLSNNWPTRKSKGIGLAIHQLLLASDYNEDQLYIEINAQGKKTYAYTEPVVMALLEHYAFDAENKIEIAQNSYRILSKAGFRAFIYQSTGYKPQTERLDSWRHFHDRVDLNFESVPFGYYSIFREISGMIVTLIRAQVIVNDKVIPDLSVGMVWGKYWRGNNLSEKYGERVKYDHNYPDYYPQSLSSPQEAWAYPDSSLADFRAWFRKEYITNKFPKYILGQAGKGKLPENIAQDAIEVLKPKELEDKSNLSAHNQALKTALDYNPKD